MFSGTSAVLAKAMPKKAVALAAVAAKKRPAVQAKFVAKPISTSVAKTAASKTKPAASSTTQLPNVSCSWAEAAAAEPNNFYLRWML